MTYRSEVDEHTTVWLPIADEIAQSGERQIWAMIGLMRCSLVQTSA
jgi:hypothetical protein